MPPRPEFRPLHVDNNEAVRVWIDDGYAITLTHSYEEDRVDVTVGLHRSHAGLVVCTVWIENRSQHDAIIDFKKTTIEDAEHVLWTLSEPAVSENDNDVAEEWRIAPGESGTFRALYKRVTGNGRSPDALTVRLSGLIGPLELLDAFQFVRIAWP